MNISTKKHSTIVDFRKIIKSSIRLVQILYFFSLTFISDAQSLSVISYDSLVVGDALNSSAIYAHASIKNNGSDAINVKVKRINGNYTALTDSNAICWGICQLPDVSISNLSIAIEAGGIDSLNFTGHVYPNRDGIAANGDITYVFFDESNPTDSATMVVHYRVVNVLSINEDVNNTQIKLYPNPIEDFLILSYSGKTSQTLTIRIYNNLGKHVYEEKFYGIAGIKRIDLSTITNGFYIYSISDDSKIMETGKLYIK